jgi:hypothetical protein
MSEKNGQDKELDQFTQDALRRNRPGSYEQLLCQHLIKAVASPQLEKIRLICEAAYISYYNDPENSPVKEDFETLDILYKVSTSFINTFVNTNDPERFPGIVAWSFKVNEENSDKYLRPWIGNTSHLYYMTEAPDYSKDVPIWRRIEHSTTSGIMHLANLEAFKAAFTDYATPIAMAIFGKLTREIDPDTYSEILGKIQS